MNPLFQLLETAFFDGLLHWVFNTRHAGSFQPVSKISPKFIRIISDTTLGQPTFQTKRTAFLPLSPSPPLSCLLLKLQAPCP